MPCLGGVDGVAEKSRSAVGKALQVAAVPAELGIEKPPDDTSHFRALPEP